MDHEYIDDVYEDASAEDYSTVWSWIIAGLIALVVILVASIARADDKYTIIHVPSTPAVSVSTEADSELLSYGVKLRFRFRAPGEKTDSTAHGSGVIVRDGILTAKHLIHPNTSAITAETDDGVKVSATVAKVSKDDAALLSVRWPSPRKFARLDDSPGQISEILRSIARGRNGLLTVEKFRRDRIEGGIVCRQAWISGESGGGVFNESLRLVGIISINLTGTEPYSGVAVGDEVLRPLLSPESQAAAKSSAGKKPLAIMYSPTWCGACRANDALMKSYPGLPFHYMEIRGQKPTDEDPNGWREFPEFVRKHAKVYGWPVWHIERADDGAIVSGYKTPTEVFELSKGAK